MNNLSYVIVVKSSPFDSQAVRSAYLFAKSLCESKHSLKQIFFMQDGVLIANKHNVVASDECHFAQMFCKLATAHNFSLTLCETAATIRGISLDNLCEGFSLDGLGQFSKVMLQTDRLISF